MKSAINVLMLAVTLASSVAFAEGFISGSEARRLISEKGAVLVDVRTVEEYQERHLPGALFFPVNTLDKDLYHLGDFDRPIVVYCVSGKRASIAKDILEKAGFKQVHNLGGVDNWN